MRSCSAVMQRGDRYAVVVVVAGWGGGVAWLVVVVGGLGVWGEWLVVAVGGRVVGVVVGEVVGGEVVGEVVVVAGEAVESSRETRNRAMPPQQHQDDQDDHGDADRRLPGRARGLVTGRS